MDERTKKMIIKMYKIGLSPREIVKAVPDFSYSTIEGYIVAFNHGFNSYTKYLEDRAKKRGYPSIHGYNEAMARNRGHSDYKAYVRHTLEVRGYESPLDYRRNEAERNRKRPRNRAMGTLIRKKLEKMKKTQVWLAGEIDLAETTVNHYVRGIYFPNDRALERIFNALGVSQRDLDTLTQEFVQID